MAPPDSARWGAVALPRSLPALAYGLSVGKPRRESILPALSSLRSVAQVYRVPGTALEAEVAATVHAVAHAAERLRRLPSAYGEWGHFDAAAYFDLSRVQTEQLVYVAERVTSVHVSFFADLLLPSFQQALALWAQSAPVWHGEALTGERFEHVVRGAAAGLGEAWQRALGVVQESRERLLADMSFLALNDAAGERWRWSRQPVMLTAGRSALAEAEPATAPTLTLSLDFPLPAWRQPERTRRLRRNRDRRARQRKSRT
jgi:hypothetical protein